MAAVAQIVIQVDDKGAVQAIQRTGAEIQGLGPAFEKAGQKGNIVLTQLTQQQRRAHDATALFARTLGIELPRQLERVVAKSALVGPAMSAAFSVAVFAGFGLAIVDLIGKIPQLVEKIFDWTGAMKANVEAQKELNPQLIEQGKQLRLLRQEYKLIGLEGALQFAQSQENIRDEIARVTAELKGSIEAQKGLRKAIEGEVPHSSLEIFIHDLKRLVGAGGDNEKQLAKMGNVTMLLGAELKNLEERLRNAGKEFAVALSEDKIKTLEEARADIRKFAEEDIAFLEKRNQLEQQASQILQALEDKEEQLRKEEKQLANQVADRWQQTIDVETEAAIAALPPWERANAQIIQDFELRRHEVERQFRGIEDAGGEAARRIAAEWQIAGVRMRDQLAGSLEALFDDITSGNIGRVFLNNFKRLVFQMVAQWILGMNQMRAASAGSFFGGGAGGILGSLLGGLLGIPLGGGGGGGGLLGLFGRSSAGSGAGTGFGGPLGLGAGISGLPLGPGTPAAASVLSLLGGGLSAGGGLGLGSALPAGAGGVFNRLGGLGGITALAGLAGAGLAGSTNPIVAGLGGLLAGGAIGSAIGSLLGGLFVFAGPIGALVGFLGGIFGLFGGRRKKRQRERLTNELAEQIKKIKDAYSFHQIDFDSAIGQLEQFRGQYAQAIHKLGGDTRARVHTPIDRAEAEIRAIEDERQRRQSVAFGPAEFHRGGLVASHLALSSPGRPGARAFHSGDVVNANLLVGESVLNRNATAQLGRSGVQALNSGQTLRPIQIVINAVDAPSFRMWLRSGGGKEILSFLRLAEAEGAF